ncbi:MAG: GNAT family N-acetyltransferase [Steroidobacteraceae bacterium]|nr:GNAT family N-acetyltransferase [Steroidobacteraceae bacterium]
MTVRVARSLAGVDAAQWNALAGDGEPFLRHEFLLALEESGCATPETGWDAHHLLHVDQSGALDGAMPLYLKSHSWGEFVFDFAWAEAFHRAGQRYYPRLVSAVPFTPATGPRLLARSSAVRDELIAAARGLARDLGVSSLHVLFPAAADQESLAAAGLMRRLDCQFHWRADGSRDFDEWLGSFASEKRKKVRRERRRVAESGLQCRRMTGAELDPPAVEAVYRLHAMTFARYGNAPYLNAGFFDRLARTMPEAMVVELAELGGEPVACAVSLRSAGTLFGRYWGAAGEFHSLHFELCYYRGIEYCLREGLGRFEPGTQGEHKLLRGFMPTPVWSLHEIVDPRFSAPIGAWLARERRRRRQWLAQALRHLPFRRGDGPARLPADVRDCLAAED